MKNLIVNIIVTAFICLSVFSCKDVLNVEPENILQANDIFSNESAIDAYLATLYNNLPLQGFDYQVPGGSRGSKHFMPSMSGEALNNVYRNRDNVGDGVWLRWWADGYNAIRIVNEFLTQIETAELSADKKNQLRGEAQFIRAYYYFELVKRYGGVPLITKAQSFSGDNVDSLQVPRNTEKQIYDFVSAQLDSAAQLMSETSVERGRADKYVAYALKSRAMLYAASEAEYGTLQLDGLVGMPAGEADHYWQQAYDAAEEVIDSENYSLYNKNPDDKTANFTNLFLDEENNPERIFARYYNYPEKIHKWDANARPNGECGGHVDPTLEFVEMFEYKEETNGKLKLRDDQGNFIQYSNPGDLFKDKDPRFAATVIYPFSPWPFDPDGIVQVQAGIIDNGEAITAGSYDELYQGRHVIGDRGIGGNLGNSPTGFYARKYLQITPPYLGGINCGIESIQPYTELRYAEILLNYAEAAVELGETIEAKEAVNQIRKRAGIQLLTDAEVTRDAIRHERNVELALEGGHKYWDIRRWRIADQLINNKQYTALYPYYVMEDDAYIFKTEKVGFNLTFYPRLYYQKIPDGEISKNPNLVQNPGY